MLVITGGKVYKDGKFTEGLDVLVEDGKIVDIVKEQTCTEGEVLDVQGEYVCPGFVDIHIHGGNGYDTMDGTEEALENIAHFAAMHGTTSFLPTTLTTPVENLQRSMKAIAALKEKPINGAQILGAHLEGPFISPKAKGCQLEECIIAPTIENYKLLVQDYADAVKSVTIAPDHEGYEELVQYLVDKGVMVSVGHTAATYEECIDAFDTGMSHTTHFYNAMSPLKHREPGVVGAALDREDITIELIADLIHIHPASLRVAIKHKNADHTVLITDSVIAAGCSTGEYPFSGQTVVLKDGGVRLKDGTLAGSALTQDQALRNIVKIGIPLEDGIKMLTETPARVIHVDSRKGKLEKGFDADIVMLDKDLNIMTTIVGGKKIS